MYTTLTLLDNSSKYECNGETFLLFINFSKSYDWIFVYVVVDYSFYNIAFLHKNNEVTNTNRPDDFFWYRYQILQVHKYDKMLYIYRTFFFLLKPFWWNNSFVSVCAVYNTSSAQDIDTWTCFKLRTSWW